MPRPDETQDPEDACTWDTCDIALKGFILLHISNHDYKLAKPQPTAQLAYSVLRNKYQNEGAYAKIKIVRDMLDTLCLPSVPKCWTFDHIVKLQSKFLKMGKLTDDQYLSIYVLNSMRIHFPRIQTSINDMLANPLTTSADIRKHLYQEDLIDSTEATTEAALTANSTKPPRPLCLNCKTLGHHVEYCIKPGGGMAGKTLLEARAAQDLACGKARTGRTNANTTNTANTASTEPAQPAANNNSNQMIVINGVNYMPIPAPTKNESALSAISMPQYNEDEYLAVLATADEPKASVNWTNHSNNTADCTLSASRSPTDRIEEHPFILNSGATCHISPEASDFKNLRAMPHRPVKGLCGSAIHAVGMGDIKLRIASGHVLKLTDILYIPESRVRLISILALNKSGNYTTHFDSTSCWVTNSSNTTLVRGTLSDSKRLYLLTTKIPPIQTPKTTQTTLFSRVPDIETWHCHLGHCNAQAIVEMAKNGVSQGMPIDLSSLPPKCDHCAIGKQMKTTVPKVQEGHKVMRRLEQVHVDLCGPMAVVSRTRNVYGMNMIDDFSGYVWSIPL